MGNFLNSNRAIKLILIGLIVVIVGLAAVLFAVGAVDKDKEVSAYSDIDTVGSQSMVIDSSQEYAKKLYNRRVEDVNDTAAVVKLLETMGIEEVAGKYTATIMTEEDIQVLSLVFEEAVQEPNKAVFDGNMEKCSQQLIALIPSVGKVQWTYPIISSGAEEETVTVSLDTAGAGQILSHDVKKYGESAKAFRTLLTEQSGEKK